MKRRPTTRTTRNKSEQRRVAPRKNPKKTLIRRLGGVALLMVFFACVLIGRAAYLQIYDHEKLSKINIGQSTDVIVLKSARGTIYDRNGRPLAESVLTKSLYGDPALIRRNHESPADIAKWIKPYVSMPESDIVAALSRTDTQFVWINRMLDYDKYEAIEKVIKEHKIEGLAFLPENKRYYPNGDLLAQTLGFVGTDDKGLDGLEMVLDKEIRGAETKKLIMHDQRGNPIQHSVFTNLIPQKQRSVTLTIDTTVQYIAEKALDKAMAQTKAVGASIIIMDPKTGEILAMANRPTYNPANFGKAREEDFKNRAVINLYEPGSTFKPIIAATALSTGKWKLDEVFNDVGYVEASGHTIRNWNDQAYGKVTLMQILKFSINTGMAHIGLATGKENLMKYVTAFGFGKETGIELPGEGTGILFKVKNMSNIDTASMSIGQGIAVTPLQMVQAFGAFANNGKMMKPHIIKEIKNPDDSVYKKVDPKEVGAPIKPEIDKEITAILEQEVETGGGHKAWVKGYQFAGKTGTAQKIDPIHGGYLKGRYIASFIGYGPLPNPRFVMLVVIDDPEGVYYGGQIAAPVFSEVMSQLVRYYRISPTRIDMDAKHQKEAIPWKSPKVVRTEDGMVIVPNFTGWTMAQVREWINKSKLGFAPQGSGFGYSQSPVGGSVVEPDSLVKVYFKE